MYTPIDISTFTLPFELLKSIVWEYNILNHPHTCNQLPYTTTREKKTLLQFFICCTLQKQGFQIWDPWQLQSFQIGDAIKPREKFNNEKYCNTMRQMSYLVIVLKQKTVVLGLSHFDRIKRWDKILIVKWQFSCPKLFYYTRWWRHSYSYPRWRTSSFSKTGVKLKGEITPLLFPGLGSFLLVGDVLFRLENTQSILL